MVVAVGLVGTNELPVNSAIEMNAKAVNYKYGRMEQIESGEVMDEVSNGCWIMMDQDLSDQDLLTDLLLLFIFCCSKVKWIRDMSSLRLLWYSSTGYYLNTILWKYGKIWKTCCK